MNVLCWKWWILIGLLLGVTAVSSIYLDADSIYKSEYRSILHTGVFDARYTVPQTLDSIIKESPQHGPLFFVILSGWIHLVSLHPITLRILSLLFAVLSVASAYRLGADLIDQRVGLFAAFVTAVSGMTIFYAHEVRMYSLFALLSTLVVILYWRIINKKGKRVHPAVWFGLYVTSTLLIYTHYFAIFLLIAIGVYHLFCVAKTKRWFQVAIVEVLAGLTFLPWLQIVVNGFVDLQDSEQALQTPQTIPQFLFDLFFVFTNGLWWVGIALALIALWYLRKSRKTAIFLMILSVVAVVTMGIANTQLPLLLVQRIRYSMFLFPILAVLFGAGLVYLLRWRWLVALILVSWIGMFLWFLESPELRLYTNRQKNEFSEYPQFYLIQPTLSTFPGQHEPLVTLHPDVDIWSGVKSFYAQWLDRPIYHVLDDMDNEDNLRAISKLADRSEGFWLSFNPQIRDLEDYAVYQEYIEDTYHACMNWLNLDGTQVDYYLKSYIPCDLITAESAPIIYQNGLQLRNVILNRQADDKLLLHMWWFQNGVPDESVGFSLQMFDAENNKVYQADHIVEQPSIVTYPIEIEDIPDGQYNLNVIVFDAETYDSIDGQRVTESVPKRMNLIATVEMVE